jgi:hypothetical protein
MCNIKGVALGGARLFSVLTKMKSSADFFFFVRDGNEFYSSFRGEIIGSSNAVSFNCSY